MQVSLFNRLGGAPLQVWTNEFDFAEDLRRGRVSLADGDTVKVSDPAEDALNDFNYVGSRHHY